MCSPVGAVYGRNVINFILQILGYPYQFPLQDTVGAICGRPASDRYPESTSDLPGGQRPPLQRSEQIKGLYETVNLN